MEEIRNKNEYMLIVMCLNMPWCTRHCVGHALSHLWNNLYEICNFHKLHWWAEGDDPYSAHSSAGLTPLALLFLMTDKNEVDWLAKEDETYSSCSSAGLTLLAVLL